MFFTPTYLHTYVYIRYASKRMEQMGHTHTLNTQHNVPRWIPMWHTHTLNTRHNVPRWIPNSVDHTDGCAAIVPSVPQSKKCAVFLASAPPSLQVHQNSPSAPKFRKCTVFLQSHFWRKSLTLGESVARLKPKWQKAP